MAGSKNRLTRRCGVRGVCLIVALLALAVGQAKADADLPGASPGERAAIVAYCAGVGDSSMAQNNVPLQPADDGFAPWAQT